MKGIDIIIPVHEYNEEISNLLTRCLSSLKKMSENALELGIKTDIQIVGNNSLPSQEIMELIEWTTEFNSFNVSENITNELDFCSQVNYAVENLCKNDYFMIVEFDDMVTDKWLNMAYPYLQQRKKCPVFLPLVEVYDIKNPSIPLSYINEIGWSSAFSDKELGVLSTNDLLEYCNYNITGAIFDKNCFVKSGGFKSSIKISFSYELLLRLANLYKEIYVIPKVGYFHFINRDNSLTNMYHNTISREEGSWWIKLATEEYQYKKDRKKTYQSDNK